MVCKQQTTFIILENIEFWHLQWMLCTCIILSNKQTACRDSLSSKTIASATIHAIQLLAKKNTNITTKLLLLQG